MSLKGYSLALSWLACSAAVSSAGCGSPSGSGDASVQSSAGGTAIPAGGNGGVGQSAAGGEAGGSSASGANGGMPSTGGLAIGGTSTSGDTGGRDSGPSGGTSQTGGVTAAGGTVKTGGIQVTGGRAVTGGIIVDGGGPATGGKTATGGIVQDGGIPATGGASGGASGDGGVAPTGWGTIHNDFFWYDQDGNLIQVRSGAMRKFGDTYYWYGSLPGAIEQTCYSSPDLVHWTYKGVVIKLDKDANRMDVLYNDTTKQYVMFLKYIGNGAYFGIATASSPEGPFTFVSKTLVDNAFIGDMSMYKDDDGKAYLAYVWWGLGTNKAHGIYRMSADYLTLDTQMYLWRIGSREAPHIFKRNGTYYYGTSETNGIQPSPTRYYTATNLAGPWSAATTMVTPGSNTTYETQCDFVLPFAGTQGTYYMFEADRWIPTGARQGDYLLLPLEFDAAGVPTANYYQDWDFNLAAGTWRNFDRATRDLALGKTATASSESGANVAAGVTKTTTWQNYNATRWESAASDAQWIMVDLGSAKDINRVILKWYSDYGKSFKIQVSTDSTTWTDVYTTTKGASYSVTDVTFAKTSARYVRMNGTQRGTQNGYSLFAFMVLNDS